MPGENLPNFGTAKGERRVMLWSGSDYILFMIGFQVYAVSYAFVHKK